LGYGFPPKTTNPQTPIPNPQSPFKIFLNKKIIITNSFNIIKETILFIFDKLYI